jgi:hypothetical protein
MSSSDWLLFANKYSITLRKFNSPTVVFSNTAQEMDNVYHNTGTTPLPQTFREG